VHVREFCPAGSGVIYELSGEAGSTVRGLVSTEAMHLAGRTYMVLDDSPRSNNMASKTIPETSSESLT
jgi:hypothetical protein